jgi:polysaccharide export outer membrane protein
LRDGRACAKVHIGDVLTKRFFVRENSVMLKRIVCAFSLIFCCALGACNLTEGPVLEWPTGAVAQAPGALRPVTAAYVLGPNDHIHVEVYGEAELTNDYEVDGSGFVSIPLTGRVKASGLTTAQLSGIIANRLSDGIIRSPHVTVAVASYAPYYIHGEVKQGGEFVYKSGLTVQDAVAAAGGFTYRADDERVFLRRAGESVEQIYRLDTAIPVYPGDNIRIPERYF